MPQLAEGIESRGLSNRSCHVYRRMISHFHAESARISDAAIASLVQCRALKELDLSENDQLTDAAFAGLSEGCWPKMESLNLFGLRRLSDASFSSLARACPSLVEVWFGSTKVTDEAVWTLCQLCPSIL